jgi:hypothetical protein
MLGLIAFILGNLWIPYAWNARLADRWYENDPALQTKMANSMEFWIQQELGREDFTTGSPQFDGEWLYGTYVMAAMGFGQMAQLHPEERERYLPLMEEAIDDVLTDRVRAFDIERWKSDPLESLDTHEGHAAYLGYLNLAMGFHRKLNPDSKYIELNDRISDALYRRVAASPSLLVESYPHETYPVDNCAVIASIAVNRALRHLDSLLTNRWIECCRLQYIDPHSGLLYQAVDGYSGQPYSYPRASGTTLGLYFLSFMDRELSKELYEAVASLTDTIGGFSFVREYPRTVKGQNGDIDSGMVILGYGLSPTGFALAGSRLHQDPKTFRHLYATAHAAGCPNESKDRFNFVTGASLGDAILFAMLTAPQGDSLQ